MLINRDPFAREELHKEVSYRAGVRPQVTCAWCGNRDAKGRLWSYEIQSDGGRRGRIKGDFCSISCMRAHSS